MPWVRIDDGLPDHPKIVQAGPFAELLYMHGLAYASRFLTDGFIPAAAVPRLVHWPDGTDSVNLAQLLIDVGLWDVVEGGYQVHDYLEYQLSRDKVLSDREARSEAKRKAGVASGVARRAKHEQNTNRSRTEAEQNANETRTKSNPIPFPSQREEEEPAREDGPTPMAEIIAGWQQGTKESGKNLASGCQVLDLLLERAEDGWSLDLLRELARESATKPVPRGWMAKVLPNLNHSNVRTLEAYAAHKAPRSRAAPESEKPTFVNGFR